MSTKTGNNGRRKRTGSKTGKYHQTGRAGSQKRRKMTARRRKKIVRRRLIFAVLVIAVIAAVFFVVNMQKSKRTVDQALTASGIRHAAVMVNKKAVEETYNIALQEAKEEKKQKDTLKAEKAKEQEESEFKEDSVHFIAVGDNLIHERIYQSTDTNLPVWNYDALYENISDYVAQADIAAVNQETVFVADHSEVSGYPEFGTPTEIGDALIEAGFDVFESATNHTYDKGISGIEDTINYWNLHSDKTYLGIHDSEEDAADIKVVESKGIKIAMLDYTASINDDDGTIPSYMIDRVSEERIAADVANAKKISDFVIVFLHDGTEYDATPSDSQLVYINAALESGADAMICSHSHVLEGFNTLTSSTGHEMLVYYGLGNFISSQESAICLLGGMADFYINKDETTGECKVYYDELVPLVTHYEIENNIYTVYKLEDYTDELAARHSITDISGESISVEWFEYYAYIAQQALY